MRRFFGGKSKKSKDETGIEKARSTSALHKQNMQSEDEDDGG